MWELVMLMAAMGGRHEVAKPIPCGVKCLDLILLIMCNLGSWHHPSHLWTSRFLNPTCRSTHLAKGNSLEWCTIYVLKQLCCTSECTNDHQISALQECLSCVLLNFGNLQTIVFSTCISLSHTLALLKVDELHGVDILLHTSWCKWNYKKTGTM